MLAGLPRRVAGRVAGKHYFKASTGVPEPPGAHDVNFLEGQAAGECDDDDDGSCFRARLADVGDEVEFARHLRTRCVHAYWLLLSAARVAETAGRLSSGVGRGALGAAWTVACVAFWLYVSLSRDVGRRIVDRAHVLVLVYISVNHALRLVYVYGLDEAAMEEERRKFYECISHPLYYVFMFLLGFFLPLTCSGEVRFQSFFACVNVGSSLAVIRVAGGDPRRVFPQIAVWAAAILVSNGAIYGVLKPLWMRAQVSSDDRLKRRVEQLSREKERITWEWQLDTMRSRGRDDGDAAGAGAAASATSPPQSTGLSLTSSFVRDVHSEQPLLP